ncbi:MAG: hypothetical protein Hyperionvirus2_222, partial [Hyperionvirus sp.]
STNVEESPDTKLKKEFEKKYLQAKADYDRLSNGTIVSILILTIALMIMARNLDQHKAIAEIPIVPPTVPQKTLKQMVLENINSASYSMHQPHEINNLETYLINVKYYRKSFGEYPPNFSRDTFLDTFFQSYGLTPEHLNNVLDLFEANINPIEQNSNILDFFRSRFFLFDHDIDNYRSQYEKVHYEKRVGCVDAVTKRISGKGIENDILKELLKHEPREFLFKLIMKYSHGKKLDHPGMAKYARKAQWFEEMFARDMLSDGLMVGYLQNALEYHTGHYVGHVITTLRGFSNSQSTLRDMSFEVIRHQARSKQVVGEKELDYMFNHLRMINYHFRPEDIRVIGVEMNNRGKEVEYLWSAIRRLQPQFYHYYQAMGY